MIRLQNPTGESLVLTPHCTNPANFNLELDNSQHILLAAGSLLEVPLKFTPSAIGRLHVAEISFHCPQVNTLCVDIKHPLHFRKESSFHSFIQPPTTAAARHKTIENSLIRAYLFLSRFFFLCHLSTTWPTENWHRVPNCRFKYMRLN